MARSGLIDPLDKYRFVVSVEGFTKSGFASCSTPSYSITANTYPEGGAHLNPRKIVDGVDYKPVTLSRGVTNDTSFVKWATGFIDLVQNNAGLGGNSSSITDIAANLSSGDLAAIGGVAQAHPVPSSRNTPFSYRRKVVISHVNRAGVTEVVYTLYNAFPIEYKPASDFDSSADDGVSMETLTLAYEGFDVRYTGVIGLAGSLLVT